MLSYPANAGGVEDVELPWAVAVELLLRGCHPATEMEAGPWSPGSPGCLTPSTGTSGTPPLPSPCTPGEQHHALALYARGAAPPPQDGAQASSSRSSAPGTRRTGSSTSLHGAQGGGEAGQDPPPRWTGRTAGARLGGGDGRRQGWPNRMLGSGEAG